MVIQAGNDILRKRNLESSYTPRYEKTLFHSYFRNNSVDGLWCSKWASGIEVKHVKMGAGAQGEDRAVYLAMRNHGSEADQLTGVSSDAAELVQFQNGTEVIDAIPVYADREFVFTPDGYHVMLIRLKQELRVGDEIEVVLQFRDHEDLTITVPVGEAIELEHEH